MLSMLADRTGAFGDLPRSGGLGDLGQAASDSALSGNFAGMQGLLGGSLGGLGLPSGGHLPRGVGTGPPGNPLASPNGPQGNLVRDG